MPISQTIKRSNSRLHRCIASLYCRFPELLNDTKALSSNIQSDYQNLNSMSRIKVLIDYYSNSRFKSIFQHHFKS